MRHHAGHNPERAAHERGGDLAGAGVGHESPQHDLAAADDEAGDEGGEIVPMHHVLLLESQAENGGEGGEKDYLGLPEKIMVCPQMGSDGFAMYTKTMEYSAPGY